MHVPHQLHLQIDGTKRDAAKVVQENNSLHVQIIKEAEKLDKVQTQHYQRVKALEAEISELSFWKHSALTRMHGFESEAVAVKDKLQDLMRLGTL